MLLLLALLVSLLLLMPLFLPAVCWICIGALLLLVVVILLLLLFGATRWLLIAAPGQVAEICIGSTTHDPAGKALAASIEARSRTVCPSFVLYQWVLDAIWQFRHKVFVCINILITTQSVCSCLFRCKLFPVHICLNWLSSAHLSLQPADCFLQLLVIADAQLCIFGLPTTLQFVELLHNASYVFRLIAYSVGLLDTLFVPTH